MQHHVAAPLGIGVVAEEEQSADLVTGGEHQQYRRGVWLRCMMIARSQASSGSTRPRRDTCVRLHSPEGIPPGLGLKPIVLSPPASDRGQRTGREARSR